MGVVAEVDVNFFLELEGVVVVPLEGGEAFVTVGFDTPLPGGDLLPPPAVVVEDGRVDPVGEALPDDGGLGCLPLDLEGLTEVTVVNLFGGGGGDSGGKLLGGGGGGGDSGVGGGGDVRLLGPLVGLAVVLLFFESNCDFIALKFLVERVRAAFCFPWPLVELLLLDEAGDEAGLFCSNMEIRSLSAFLTAGELML